jgi:hypothetical protein
MRYNAFISYAAADTDIVENLRDYLNRYGVNAWVYSLFHFHIKHVIICLPNKKGGWTYGKTDKW